MFGLFLNHVGAMLGPSWGDLGLRALHGSCTGTVAGFCRRQLDTLNTGGENAQSAGTPGHLDTCHIHGHLVYVAFLVLIGSTKTTVTMTTGTKTASYDGFPWGAPPPRPPPDFTWQLPPPRPPNSMAAIESGSLGGGSPSEIRGSGGRSPPGQSII